MAGINGTSVGLDNLSLIIEPVVQSTAITSYSTVLREIKSRQLATVLGAYSKITFADGGCGVGAVSADIPSSEYTWLPIELKAWQKYCLKNLRTNLIAIGIGLGYEAADISKAVVAVQQGVGTATQNKQISAIIMDMFTKAVTDDIVRKSWFGDTSMALISGGGVLRNSDAVANYNEFDGYYKQLATIVAGDASRRYTITENGLSTYALQDALASGRAKEILQGLYYNATEELSARTDKVFIVSRSIVNNWELTNQGNTYRESDKIQMENGTYAYTFMGVPIVVVPDWDRYIKADFINGTKYTLPRHFALYTSLSAIQTGFDTDDMNMATNWWYDEKDELFNIRSTFAMDVKIPNASLVQVAY